MERNELVRCDFKDFVLKASKIEETEDGMIRFYVDEFKVKMTKDSVNRKIADINARQVQAIMDIEAINRELETLNKAMEKLGLDYE